ncbi:hypothetical protein K491DRAFT_688719 [Lophiostoma macrostomum CBS 122681]|uniref:Heterokaryon incompatibility domain-containing protein n=1 Tax=Lophiostoma macrostomum CBS 122681 TaxID=1314788 RepID=A0A6A6TJA8_9PLEO|nr:hypothetical protein K491DRAFT_688719 [Lophiostoma macrostomum CBS 122681]
MGCAIDLERRRQPDFDFEKLARYIAACDDAYAGHRQSISERGDERAALARTDSGYSELETVTIKYGAGEPIVQDVSLLLPTFWNSDLDTPCMVCGQAFQQLDPPIRSVALERLDPLVVQVSNRHLNCVQASGVGIIPVSHVWHEAIAEANLSGKNTAEASRCLYKVLSEMLPTVNATFVNLFGRVELWHDYLSIPQWQRPIQQALLVMLPHIYKSAPLCLIHLDDISSQHIVAATKSCANANFWGAARRRRRYKWEDIWSVDQDTTQVDTRVTSDYQRYEALTRFFRARWFQRMWVSLEYAQCRQACVYTKDHTIIWNGDGNDCDSFSWLFDGFQQRMRQCVEDLGMDEFSKLFMNMPLPLLGPLADMRKNTRTTAGPSLSFGEALTFIAGRNCTCYRDRFLAMSSFLKCGDYASSIRDIPPDAADACLWVARKCLAIGDYSALLMLRKSQDLHPSARWLVGHKSMAWDMWDLGPLKPRPTTRKIHLVDNVIRLELDNVGAVEKLWEPHFKNEDHITVFDYVLQVILSHYPVIHSRSLQCILNTLDRVYAVPTFLRPSYAQFGLSNQYLLISGHGSEALKGLFEAHLQHPLISDVRLAVSGAIARQLGFQTQLKGTGSSWTRLSYASNPLHQEIGYHDCLARARCPSCTETFLYRVSILKGVKGVVYLYRIPQLEYTSSLRNGVGILVSENEIVGRMIYGTPACGCRELSQSVEIW